MSELDERHWAVISERGCEGNELTYEMAVRLVDRLLAEKTRGLSIISQQAAQRMTDGASAG